METIEALATFIVMAVSLEFGILTWVRATLTSKDSTRPLHDLVIQSKYRFFWLPKVACGLAMIGALTLAFHLNPEGDTLEIASLALIPIFGAFVAYEAVRTKE